MKTRERKQEDLNALTEQLNNSKSAMIVSFNKLTVNKDQEFRNHLRDAGAQFQVVKNTSAVLPSFRFFVQPEHLFFLHRLV